MPEKKGVAERLRFLVWGDGWKRVGEFLLDLQSNRMTVKAIFIVGLPGSGKSIYSKNMSANVGAKLFDDFKANAIDNCSLFPFSRQYVELVNTLKSGIDCIISDIDFCSLRAREEAELCIRELVPEIEIEWRFFENNPTQCCKNVDQRATSTNRNATVEKENINKYSKVYVIPKGSEIIPVWKPK